MRKRNGFTLLELIVVIGLMGIVTSMGVTMFFKMSDAWKKTTARVELEAKSALAFESMRKDFSEIVSSDLAGVSITGTSAFSGDRVPHADDSVTIPVLRRSSPDGPLARESARYYIDRGEDGPALVRAVGDSVQPIVPDVVRMNVEYGLPSGAWTDEWKEASMPRAVRVSLTLIHPDQLDEQIVRKSVFLVNVN